MGASGKSSQSRQIYSATLRDENFISLLRPCELVLAAEPNEIKIKIGGGIMHVRDDTVTVYLDV